MTPPRAPLWPSTATPHRRRATPPPLPRDAGRCPPNGEREREGEGAAERPREIGAPRVMRRSEAYTLLGTRIEESLTTLMRNGELCLAPRSSVSSGRSIRGWESLMWKGEGECHVTHCGHPYNGFVPPLCRKVPPKVEGIKRNTFRGLAMDIRIAELAAWPKAMPINPERWWCFFLAVFHHRPFP